MRENFESWLEFANANYSWGLDLKEEELLFVCSTIKTVRWAMAAFQGRTFRKKEGYVSGDFGPFASGGFSVNISNQALPANHYRHGPLQTGTLRGEAALMHTEHSQSSRLQLRDGDQTLFVHYYKMKRRAFLWPLKEPIQAAGGPHQLPPGEGKPGMGATMVDGVAPKFFPLREPPNGQVRICLALRVFTFTHIDVDLEGI